MTDSNLNELFDTITGMIRINKLIDSEKLLHIITEKESIIEEFLISYNEFEDPPIRNFLFDIMST